MQNESLSERSFKSVTVLRGGVMKAVFLFVMQTQLQYIVVIYSRLCIKVQRVVVPLRTRYLLLKYHVHFNRSQLIIIIVKHHKLRGKKL